MHALGLLPALRKVFLLCAIQGFTIEEAAAILQISPTAATLRLARARREIDIRLRPCDPESHSIDYCAPIPGGQTGSKSAN